MPDTVRETPAERQVQFMRTDIANGLDDILASLQAVTRGGGRLAVTGGNLLEREFNMAVSLSEEVRDSVISREALESVRAQPINRRLRDEGHRFVDLLTDVGGVLVHGTVNAFDAFFTQRPPLRETEASD